MKKIVTSCLLLGASLFTTHAKAAEIEAQAVLTAFSQASLASQIQARVEKIHVRRGDNFKQGQTLVEFDCRINRLMVNKVRSQLNFKEKQLKANNRLAKLDAISEIEMAKAISEVEQLHSDLGIGEHKVNFCKVVAPYNGQVIQLNIHEYESVNPGDKIIEIIDNQNFALDVILPSSALAWLKEGQEFTVTIKETGKSYPAVVNKIVSKIDAISQSIHALGTLKNTNDPLVSGMSGVAKFTVTQ